MGLRGFAPTTPLSAAMTLANWIATKGRPPTFRECSAGNSLNHPDFYYRKFQTSSFASAITAALDMVRNPPILSTSASPVSAIVGQTSAVARRYKKCLGDCGHMILDEGHHVRFCMSCRKEINRRERNGDALDIEYPLSRRTLRKVSFDLGGFEDMIQW